MDQRKSDRPGAQQGTAVQRKSDRELVVTRLFDAPPQILFKAWAEPQLFRRWWVPEGFGITLLSCEMDVRTGGGYRLEFASGDTDSLAFYGRYLEVAPNQRIVWTNEEGIDGAITIVTFEDQDGKTRLTFSELYPSKEALDEAMEGSAAGLPTQLDQLDEVLRTLGE